MHSTTTAVVAATAAAASGAATAELGEEVRDWHRVGLEGYQRVQRAELVGLGVRRRCEGRGDGSSSVGATPVAATVPHSCRCHTSRPRHTVALHDGVTDERGHHHVVSP